MKILLKAKAFTAYILSLLLLSCTPAHASQNAVKTADEVCSKHAELAESLMSLYQKGMPIRQILEIGREIEGKTEEQFYWFKSMVLSLSKTPVYNTPSYQLKAIAAFSDKALVECYEAMKD